jgi:hypothetical protein
MRVDLLREIFLGGREHRDTVTMRAKQDGQPPTDVRVVIDDDQIQDDLRDAIVSSPGLRFYACPQSLSSNHKR